MMKIAWRVTAEVMTTVLKNANVQQADIPRKTVMTSLNRWIILVIVFLLEERMDVVRSVVYCK